MTTILIQIEACLNSRPIGKVPHNNDEGIEMLTPGHFLIGRPLKAVPDHPHSFQPLNNLKRWHLCQSLVRHFWERWRSEYLVALRNRSKWNRQNDNLQVGDIVVVKEDNLVVSHWPIAVITDTHPGADGLVRVVTLKTKNGVYKRPVVKITRLLSCDNSNT